MKENYPNIAACDPRQCVSGKIMRCSRIVSSVYRKYLLPFEITSSQLSLMFVITKSGEIVQQDIANALYMDKSTVNRNIKRLLDYQWVEKTNKVLRTTEKGKKKLEKIIPEWYKATEEIKSILKEVGLESLNILTNTLTT